MCGHGNSSSGNESITNRSINNSINHDIYSIDEDLGKHQAPKVGPEGYLYATLFGYKTGDIVSIVPLEANARAEE